MDIRQLEAYVYTVKYRSFSLAAQKLYLSQPTVSAHICNLEKELHTQLLKRTTKTLSVTPAGQTLYNYAAEILDLRHKAILELSNEQETMLHIGVSSVPSLYLLPELLAAYHEKAPEIRFRTSCSDSLDVINKVADSTCDIGLVGTKTAEANCEFLPVTSDELVIAAPNTPHFRAYQSQPDPLTALLREPFLLREDNSGTKQETLYFLQNHGLSLDELNVIAVMDDAGSAQAVHRTGHGHFHSVARNCADRCTAGTPAAVPPRTVSVPAPAVHCVSVHTAYVRAGYSLSGFYEKVLSDWMTAVLSGLI